LRYILVPLAHEAEPPQINSMPHRRDHRRAPPSAAVCCSQPLACVLRRRIKIRRF
jgi:hypothetical protein